MSEAVLISIKPEWCEKIANGEKSVEVRKTQPKHETPFKCYIYCTKPGFPHEDHITLFDKQRCFYAGGKVIGEFVCDRITLWPENETPPIPLAETCLKYSEIRAYAGESEMLFLWHISGLQIYDTSKALSEFKPWKRECKYSDLGFAIPKCSDCDDCKVERAPQSWCYVEELQGGEG